MIQDTLVYIDDKDRLDASVMANSYTQDNTKNRVYINTIGAQLVRKYLATEDIKIENLQNIHSIKKVLEEIDIADIILPNIHIDVRTVFDENMIFIPKTHFQLEITPDIYVVACLSEDNSNVRLLGFFEPKLINQNNSNDEYFFIEKEKLNPIADLTKFINKFKGNTNKNLSQDEIKNAENLIVKMTDNDISNNDKKHLLKLLCKSEVLRDKFIEYENFETLSYKAISTNDVIKKDIEIPEEYLQDNFDDVFEGDDFDVIPENFGHLDENTEELAENIEDIENIEELKTEQEFEGETTSFDDIPELEMQEDENIEKETLNIDNIEDLNIEQDKDFEKEVVSFDNVEELDIQPENQIEKDTFSFENVQELSPENEVNENEIISFDNIETISSENPVEEGPEILDDSIFVNDENIDSENNNVIETIDNATNETFGKNLIENLSEEDNIEENNSEEIISQISDIIDTSSQISFEEQVNLEPIEDVIETSEEENNEDNKLNVLFEENSPEIEEFEEEHAEIEKQQQTVPGAALFKSQTALNNKKTIAAVAIVATVIVATGAFFLLKPKDNNISELEPISPVAVEEIPNENVLETNTPDIQKIPEVSKTVTKKQVQELKNNVTTPKPKVADSALDVKRIVWDVPDVLSYSSKIQSYLRTAGKSIKLSLSADLLLATEYAYKNQVKINLKIDQNGSVQDAKVVSTSGSNQIDNIVLQSVKETLSVVKPPSNEIKTPNANLSIIIYF